MSRSLVAVVAAVLTLVITVGVASAHVTVWPRQTIAGAFERYAVRVPTEKDIPTVQVELQFPEGLTVSSFQPKPGWTYEVQRDAVGTITGVIWSGGQIGSGEFDEFGFVARNPEEPSELIFVAYQTYQDGSVVTWDGSAGSENPASITTVTEAPVDAVEDNGQGAERPQTTDGRDVSESPLGAMGIVWLSVLALVLGLVALVLSMIGLRRRRT